MKYIFLIAVWFSCVGLVYAEVSQFVFTNEPRTADVGVLSESLTIQSQNSSGVAEPITETTDLSFQSSCSSGVFLNSSGNPVSTTMSKNTSNRTFYYKDTSQGVCTLSVTATGRDTQKSFTTSQQITVGTQTSQSTTTQSSGTQTPTQTEESHTTQATLSSHTSPVPLSDMLATLPFEVTSGRDRLTTVGTEVVFSAEVSKKSGIPDQYASFRWNFGDGSTAVGKVVSHRYVFEGEYTVVLNASYSDKQAVSKTSVSVTKPTLSLSLRPGGVQIKNESSREINIGEWSIVSQHIRTALPQDTIIAQKGTIVIPLSVLSDEVVLINPLEAQIASVRSVSEVEKTLVSTSTATSTGISVQHTSPNTTISYVSSKPRAVQKTEQATQVTETTVQPQLENQVALIYTGAPKTTILDLMFDAPRKGIAWVVSWFK